MSMDIEKLINEDIDLKNEMHSIFKQIETGYLEMFKTYEKFEKPLFKVSENLKEYARIISKKQEDSPFFTLAKKYESLIDAQKQFLRNVQDNVIKLMDDIIDKSTSLNDTIKELNTSAKDVRKLKTRIEKLGEEIEKSQVKTQPEKTSKKEAEKKGKETELNLSKERLTKSLEKFEKISRDFNLERDSLLKNALLKLTDAEKAYIEAMKSTVAGEEEAAGKL